MKRKVELGTLEEGEGFEHDGTWYLVCDEVDDEDRRLLVDVETGTIFRWRQDEMVIPKNLYFCEE